MWPWLRSGDWLLVRRTGSLPRVGELWVANMQGQYVAHCVKEVTFVDDHPMVLMTNILGVADPLTPHSELVGRIEWIQRERRWLPPARGVLVSKLWRRSARWMRRVLRANVEQGSEA